MERIPNENEFAISVQSAVQSKEHFEIVELKCYRNQMLFEWW